MLLEFFRKGMENELYADAVKDLDREDTGLFVELCNRRTKISKLPYMTLQREWKKLKKA